MKKILISGYYGFKNSGDDALLKSITQDLKKYKNDVRIVVLSRNPKETTRLYGVESINRMNLFAVLSALLRCDMLISGGGTLVQDGTSTKSLLYYLSIISCAKLFGRRVMLYSNGIGPLKDENVKHTRDVLNKVDVITLRDQMSFDELKRIGVTKPKIILTADPAFNLESAPREVGRRILEKLGVPKGKRLLCISVRPWKNLGAAFEDTIARAADYAARQFGFYTVFLPMQEKSDYAISKRIQEKMETESKIVLPDADISGMLAVIGEMDLCIGMRLHSLIYAVTKKVPVIGLVYDPKVAGFMEYMQQHRYLQVDTLAFDALKGYMDDCMEHYEQTVADLEAQLRVLKQKAEENAKYAIDLLEEC